LTGAEQDKGIQDLANALLETLAGLDAVRESYKEAQAEAFRLNKIRHDQQTRIESLELQLTNWKAVAKEYQEHSEELEKTIEKQDKEIEELTKGIEANGRKIIQLRNALTYSEELEKQLLEIEIQASRHKRANSDREYLLRDLGFIEKRANQARKGGADE
jgi:chromosome segregation ATPase